MSKRLSSEEEQILGMSYSGMRQGYENWHVAVESSVLHRAVADYGRQGFYGYMRDHASQSVMDFLTLVVLIEPSTAVGLPGFSLLADTLPRSQRLDLHLNLRVV